MPGIIGVITQSPAKEIAPLVTTMVDCMRRESFYTSGTYFAPEAGVYAGFVEFQDSREGIFCNAKGTISLVFAGECFVGTQIASGETLIQVYEREGEKMLETLNGL
ncbi:MAG TPA: hypothetical protein VGV18_11440, partial [Verrucomicrobiae bacterium]|nr:hypothetical protein [Verrucomicrobiae bacterium]